MKSIIIISTLLVNSLIFATAEVDFKISVEKHEAKFACMTTHEQFEYLKNKGYILESLDDQISEGNIMSDDEASQLAIDHEYILTNEEAAEQRLKYERETQELRAKYCPEKEF